MQQWRCIVIALTLLCMGILPGIAQQPGAGTTTIKGVRTSIKSVISGPFVQFRVD